MYCRNCGKEIPNNANFCQHCGERLKEGNKNYAHLLSYCYSFFQKHKIAICGFSIWFLIHLTLYISSEKSEKIVNNHHIYTYHDFYPFDLSFSSLIQGHRTPEIAFLGKSIDTYDFTEFFAYVIIFPLVIYGLIRLFKLVKKKSSSIILYAKAAFDLLKSSIVWWMDELKKWKTIFFEEKKSPIDKLIDKSQIDDEIEDESIILDFIDYYLILGINKDASLETIKSSYEERKNDLFREKGKKWFSSQKAKDIDEAYIMLSNPSNRGLYDKELECYNTADDIKHYEIANQRLAHIIEYERNKIENKHIPYTPQTRKTEKALLWVAVIIIVLFLNMCTGAMLTQKGRQDVKNKTSYIYNSQKTCYVYRLL